MTEMISNGLNVWAKGLVAAVVSGVASGVLSVVGTQMVGVDLTWTQLGVVAASNALVSLCAYLKQSPLPE